MLPITEFHLQVGVYIYRNKNNLLELVKTYSKREKEKFKHQHRNTKCRLVTDKSNDAICSFTCYGIHLHFIVLPHIYGKALLVINESSLVQYDFEVNDMKKNH